VVVSPIAVNFALASLCAGSEGATRDQLRDVLRHRILGSAPLETDGDVDLESLRHASLRRLRS